MIDHIWINATTSTRKLATGMTTAYVGPTNIVVYGEGGKKLAQIDDIGNVTYAEGLILEDAKDAIRILLEKILEMQK
jgi:hypothetical protein